jgi:hypothetical protein
MVASLTLPSIPAGPQLLLSLQQNVPDAPVVARRHWYPAGQPSADVQGAFAAGGATAAEKQPANAAPATHKRNVDAVLE